MAEDEDDYASYESLSTLTDAGDDADNKESQEAIRVKLTKELIAEAQKELGLIKLCWPEVDLRKDVYLKTLPSSYCTLNNKEKVLAWYAENFRQQFCVKHPNRKPLLLVCENECGVQKFVSTTIRPSTLPYPELYTWQGCGKFVGDYIEYEPLEKPLNMPLQLRSPTWVQKFQKGNCFESAIFLVSLLLGQGYNAFVVSGYASKEQTLCDLKRMRCPYLRKAKPPPPTSTTRTEITKYQMKPPTEFTSEFLAELEQEQAKKVQEKLRRQEEEEKRLIEELEQVPTDKYWGHRIHAWAAILPELGGLRDAEFSGPLFIEPSTGISYSSIDYNTDQVYLGVESVWNQHNYWVNMQPASQSCATIKWDLTKIEFWEHLLSGEPISMRGEEEMDEEIAMLQEKHLDMPVSYVNEINISISDFDRRYPNGMKSVHYKKAKVEFFSPHFQADGLIQRITTYDDYTYTDPVQINEYYANRSDHLVKHKTNLDDNSVVDYYERGRPDRCKEHRYFANDASTVETERILDFYSISRFDGLSRIELHPNFSTHHFVDRDDLLYYRNEAIKASKDIAIREFAVGENEIRLMYHYHPGQYSRATRVYTKPALAERGERLILTPAMTKGYNPWNEPEKWIDLFYELDTQLKAEDTSLTHLREGQEEVTAFLKIKDEEYLSPNLSICIYDQTRESESLTHLITIERTREQSKKDIHIGVDYLQPHLARIGYPAELSKSTAYLLHHECLEYYKNLLVDRANNILRKFDEYSQELIKMQALLSQSEDFTREEEDKILEEMNQINFLMQTLDARLERHRNLVPLRYRMLLKHLTQHPQLILLRQHPRSVHL